jgi:hypothetical protein
MEPGNNPDLPQILGAPPLLANRPLCRISSFLGSNTPPPSAAGSTTMVAGRRTHLRIGGGAAPL